MEHTVKTHPWRTGFCDALFNRECDSPFKKEGWGAIRKNALYLDGYLAGEEARENGAGIQPERGRS